METIKYSNRRHANRHRSRRIKKMMGEQIYKLILELDHATFVRFIQGDFDNDEQFWDSLAFEILYD